MAEQRPRQSSGGRQPPPGGRGRQGGSPDSGAGSGAARRRDAEADAAEAALKQLRGKLANVLRRLPDVERQVLELRMGLAEGTPLKPGEVAQRMGMTIPEVRKIEARAFERIREVGPIKGLERFLAK